MFISPWSVWAVYASSSSSSCWMFSSSGLLEQPTMWDVLWYFRQTSVSSTEDSFTLKPPRNNWIEGSAARWLFPPHKHPLPFSSSVLLIWSWRTHEKLRQRENMDALILLLFILVRFSCVCKYCRDGVFLCLVQGRWRLSSSSRVDRDRLIL